MDRLLNYLEWCYIIKTMLNLATPIEKLPRVGPRFLARLKKLGIMTIKDLLWHFPIRYEDYSRMMPISDIKNSGEIVSIIGQVASVDVVRSWKRRMAIVNAWFEDSSGTIRAVWFNQPYIADSLKEGTLVSLSGKISVDKNGLYLSSPSYERLQNDLTHTGRLVPIYPETEGLTSKYLRFLIKPILAQISAKGGSASGGKKMEDPLPQELLKKYNLPSLAKAMQNIHFPENLEETEAAKKRFALEELLLFQLRALRDHRQLQMLKAPQIVFNKEMAVAFVKSLPFELTNDQRIAAYEILQDLARPFPMNRLLNGDVGSGKTVVALMAACQVAAAGYQTVFMAPTEILAKQHFATIKSLTKNEKTTIGLLTGNEAKQWSRSHSVIEDPRFSERKSGPIDETEEAPTPLGVGIPTVNGGEKISKKLILKKIADGQIDIIIGTHAVIQKNIKFAKLGLVVIDEQHRFGVSQRMKLIKNQQLVPHLLSMTATPIPRTLALTIYGDLDVSLIKEKPKGRQTIITRLVSQAKRDGAYKFIDQQIEQGRQVFVICPRIDTAAAETTKSDTAKARPLSQAKLVWAEVKAVTEEYGRLAQKVFPQRQVAMLHGRLKAKEKDEIMKKFSAQGGSASGGKNQIDILVSTSVVEVGVDIPNATIMMIESAERFGLAQLHQFRGRVGRGEHQSYCLLFTSNNDIPSTRALRALEKTDNGFELAEADLKIRGPGEFSGLKQSGLPDFAMASLADIDLIKKARLEARLLLKEDPTLQKYPLLLTRLNEMQRLVHFE